MGSHSRRSFLKASALSAASLVTFESLFGYSQLAAQGADDLQTILTLAATAEVLATTHYYSVLTEGDIALTPLEVEMIMGFLDAELQHLEVLYDNGAQALVTDFYVPDNIYLDRIQFSEVTEFMETTFVAAYLAATRRLAELGEPLLAATTAQVVGIEQEHLALVRQIGGKRANNLSFSRPLFYNVSEAGGALQPFLEGGPNFSTTRSYPGADAIRELIRDVGVLHVATFIAPEDFASPEAIAQGQSACSVTSGGDYNANLRAGPSLAFRVVGRLEPGMTLEVSASALDNDGFTWLRATGDERWVRSDIVRFLDDCGALPAV